jgi:hypothetical protein
LLTGVKRGEWLGIGVCLFLATLLYMGVCARQGRGSRRIPKTLSVSD